MLRVLRLICALSAVWSARTNRGWTASTTSSTESASELGSALKAERSNRILRLRVAHLGEILVQVLPRKREGENSSASFFPVLIVYAQQRLSRSGSVGAGPRGGGPTRNSITRSKGAEPGWRSVSAQHPQLLQVAPVSQRPRVVSVEAVDLVVEGRSDFFSTVSTAISCARLRSCAKAALRSLPSSSTSRYSRWTLVTAFFGTPLILRFSLRAYIPRTETDLSAASSVSASPEDKKTCPVQDGSLWRDGSLCRDGPFRSQLGERLS